jgi:hypothetical protein
MNSRLNDRLKQLEAKIAPRGRHFCILFLDGEPSASSAAEQIAAFREHGVGPNDQLHTVILTWI